VLRLPHRHLPVHAENDHHVERTAAAARFRRLAKDDERLQTTLVGLHFVAFVCLMLHQAASLLAQVPNTVYTGHRLLLGRPMVGASLLSCEAC
jgi:hypothetical protein